MQRRRWGWLAMAAAAAMASTGPTALAYDAITVSDGAIISGTITFAGTPPPARTIKTTKHHQQCGTEVPDESLLVGPEKGIKNVVIRLTDIKRGKKWDGKAVLDQKQCRFQPHVVVVPGRPDENNHARPCEGSLSPAPLGPSVPRKTCWMRWVPQLAGLPRG